MFIGSVPRKVVTQLTNIVDIKRYKDVFICCSGSFRVDLAIGELYPDSNIHSNDISLLSVALGRYLTGQTFNVSYKGNLEPLSKFGNSGLDQLASVLIASEISKQNPKTEYGQSIIHQIHNEIDALHESTKSKIEEKYAGRSVASFSECDFREHPKSNKDALIIGFPPTYKGGYESQYKRLDENTEWESPDYEVWNPDNMLEWITSLGDQPYCIFIDYELEGLEPSSLFQRPQAHPIYLYTNAARDTSLREENPKYQPFKYTALDPDDIDRNSSIEVRPISAQQLNFLRNIYLSKRIQFTNGMTNSYAVYIDGKIAGCFAGSVSKFQRSEYFLLTDFTLSRKRKISKLIAMLATSRQVISMVEVQLILRLNSIGTKIFTDRASSMKYRGIYKKVKSDETGIYYRSYVREGTVTEVYKQWFDKYAKN